MTRRLLVTYLTITAFALALLAVPLGVTFAHREKERLLFGIERDADSIAAVVEGSAHRAEPFRNTDIERYAARTGGHVIVVDTHGIALLDTQRPTDPGRDYSTRPEIRAALTGRRVDGSRNSNTLRTNLLYAAVPTTAGGRVSGAVRVTYPASTLNERVWRTWERIGLLCTGVLAAVALLGFVLARSVTRPVHRLEQATDRLAAADLNVRVDELAGPPELRHLASTFNRMAERLAALLDAQERFVADASHQLRTPLTALRLRLENLEAHVDEPDRAAVQSAAAEVTRMSRLVDGLLALRAERRGADDRRRGRRCGNRAGAGRHLARRAVGTAERHRARRTRPRVGARGPGRGRAGARQPDRQRGRGRPTRHDHRRAGGERRRHGRAPCARRGPGLGPDDRAQAFERFWRSAGAPGGGSGLGLAVVRQLAEASGGSARLDARTGRGLDAVVVLKATVAPRLPART